MSDFDDLLLPDDEDLLEKPLDKRDFMTFVELPAIERNLQRLLDINPKIWNEFKEKGVIPERGTYKDFIVPIFDHYRNRKRTQDEKVKRRTISADKEEAMTEIIMAEKVAKIRVDRAREEQIHIDTLTKRTALVDRNEVQILIQPFITNIINVLRSASDTNPDLQESVDKCFTSLYELGQTLLTQVEEDKDNFVNARLHKPIDFMELVNGTDLEI